MVDSVNNCISFTPWVWYAKLRSCLMIVYLVCIETDLLFKPKIFCQSVGALKAKAVVFAKARQVLRPHAALIGLLGALFISCESDPLLSPQAEDKEETGSYGRSNLREAPVVPNPEIF